MSRPFCTISLVVGSLSLGTSMANAASFKPVRTQCSNDMPSCAPKKDWVCIHPGITLPGYCDPNDPGCLDT